MNGVAGRGPRPDGDSARHGATAASGNILAQWESILGRGPAELAGHEGAAVRTVHVLPPAPPGTPAPPRARRRWTGCRPRPQGR